MCMLKQFFKNKKSDINPQDLRVVPTIDFWGAISIDNKDVLENALKDGVIGEQLEAFYRTTDTTAPEVKIFRNGKALSI